MKNFLSPRDRIIEKHTHAYIYIYYTRIIVLRILYWACTYLSIWNVILPRRPVSGVSFFAPRSYAAGRLQVQTRVKNIQKVGFRSNSHYAPYKHTRASCTHMTRTRDNIMCEYKYYYVQYVIIHVMYIIIIVVCTP